MRTTEDGNQIISLFIPPGELFGIAAALGRVTCPASAVTATAVAALAWPMRLWSQIAMRHSGFARATHCTIGGRFAEMNDRLLEMATRQVQHRVARTLLRLAAQSRAGDGDGVEIALPITRHQTSEMGGTTLHTVSRLLSAWEKRGIVGSRREHVSICNATELKALGAAS